METCFGPDFSSEWLWIALKHRKGGSGAKNVIHLKFQGAQNYGHIWYKSKQNLNFVITNLFWA